MKILIIGGGNMGNTYSQSFLRAHIASKEDVMILERRKPDTDESKSQKGGTIYYDAAACVPLADLIILAVKPQDSMVLFQQIKPLISAQQVFISIMAGVTIQTIKNQLSVQKIIRAMPNMPSQIGMGMTVFTSTDEVTRLELVMVQNLLSTTGKTLYVATEQLIDAATAISGTGPAYVYYFMDALIEAAKKMGFKTSEAELLVNQTFSGALDLFNKSDLSCDEWISKVASKGGTTEAALNLFRAENLRQKIISGANAAQNRAEELGK